MLCFENGAARQTCPPPNRQKATLLCAVISKVKLRAVTNAGKWKYMKPDNLKCCMAHDTQHEVLFLRVFRVPSAPLKLGFMVNTNFYQ